MHSSEGIGDGGLGGRAAIAPSRGLNMTGPDAGLAGVASAEWGLPESSAYSNRSGGGAIRDITSVVLEHARPEFHRDGNGRRCRGMK